MAITQLEAWVFLPFILPICFYVAFTDLREMRITNQAVTAVGIIFVVLGLFAIPWDVYLWRLAQLVIVLVIGFVLNAAGAVGAGDAKFAAAAAPYVAVGDGFHVAVLFSATLLAAVTTHRVARLTPLRNVTPDWISWSKGKDFPMGLALGGTLGIYLIEGALGRSLLSFVL